MPKDKSQFDNNYFFDQLSILKTEISNNEKFSAVELENLNLEIEQLSLESELEKNEIECQSKQEKIESLLEQIKAELSIRGELQFLLKQYEILETSYNLIVELTKVDVHSTQFQEKIKEAQNEVNKLPQHTTAHANNELHDYYSRIGNLRKEFAKVLGKARAQLNNIENTDDSKGYDRDEGKAAFYDSAFDGEVLSIDYQDNQSFTPSVSYEQATCEVSGTSAFSEKSVDSAPQSDSSKGVYPLNPSTQQAQSNQKSSSPGIISLVFTSIESIWLFFTKFGQESKISSANNQQLASAKAPYNNIVKKLPSPPAGTAHISTNVKEGSNVLGESSGFISIFAKAATGFASFISTVAGHIIKEQPADRSSIEFNKLM